MYTCGICVNSVYKYGTEGCAGAPPKAATGGRLLRGDMDGPGVFATFFADDNAEGGGGRAGLGAAAKSCRSLGDLLRCM